MPKPFLYGSLYGSSLERGLDYAYGRDPSGGSGGDPNAVKKYMLDLFNHTPLNPESLFGISGAQPVFEAAANYSFFRDAPIESLSQQRLSKEFRSTAGTSETAKLINRITGAFIGGERLEISPIKADHLIRGIFAGLGKYGTDAIDYTAAKLGLMDIPEKPRKTLKERPFSRAFNRSPYEPSRFVERFHKGFGLAERRRADFRHLPDTLTTGRERRWWKKNEKAHSYYAASGNVVMRALGKARTELGEINQAMHTVRESREFTPNEKRDRLIFLNKQRNEMAEIFFKILHPEDQKKVY